MERGGIYRIKEWFRYQSETIVVDILGDGRMDLPVVEDTKLLKTKGLTGL